MLSSDELFSNVKSTLVKTAAVIAFLLLTIVFDLAPSVVTLNPPGYEDCTSIALIQHFGIANQGAFVGNGVLQQRIL